MDLFTYLAEVCCVPVFFILGQAVVMQGKYLRKLSKEEVAGVQRIFGDQIDCSSIFVNTAMNSRIRKFAYAYVSLNTVHFDRSIPDSILMHEMMHVYQYQRYGVVYAFRALAAQRSEEKYDYGGATGLFDAMMAGKSLEEFNFEQQAQIVEDYYCVYESQDVACPPILMTAYLHYAQPLKEEYA